MPWNRVAPAESRPFRRQLHNPVPPLWRFHDAPQRRDLIEEPGHDTVGCNHEILDQIRGTIPLLWCDIHHLLVQYHRTRFISINI